MPINKKGQEANLGNLLTIGITLVVVGIALALGIQVTGDTKDGIGEDNCAARTDGFTNYNSTKDQCYNSSGSHTQVGTAEFNASTDTVTGVSKITGKLPTIGLVVAAVVIVGLLVSAFAFTRR